MEPSARYKALLNQRAQLQQKANAFSSSTATPTAEQLAEAKDVLAQLKAIDEQLELLEAIHAAERRAPAASGDSPAVTVRDRSQDDPNCGYRDIAAFAHSVVNACRTDGRAVVDPRLAAIARAEAEADARRGISAGPSDPMSENGTVGEGYLVPPAMREQIWRLVFSPEGLLEFLQPEPTSSNSVGYNKDEATPWGSAGIQAKWLDAGEQYTRSKQPTKQGNNKLYKLGAFVEADDELLEDAPRLASRLQEGAAGAITWKAEEACFAGDGVGKPLGFFNSPALVTQTKEGSQVANTIVAKNVLKMFARAINPQLCRWFITKQGVVELGTMTIGDQPVWTPPVSGMKEAPGGFLLGRPVSYSRHNEQLGTKGDILLVDPTGYLLNIKTGGIRFASSIHLWFDFGTQCFRWDFRIGGTPILSAPVDPPKGSITESHFITLETRA